MELSEHALFGRLSEEELVLLQGIVRERELVPAEALFREGLEANAFYLLVEGKARISCTRSDGGQERLGVLTAGAVLGVTGLGGVRSATAAAMGPARVLEVPMSALRGRPRSTDGLLAMSLCEIVALAQNYQLRSANRLLISMVQELKPNAEDTDAWTDVDTDGGWASR